MSVSFSGYHMATVAQCVSIVHGAYPMTRSSPGTFDLAHRVVECLSLFRVASDVFADEPTAETLAGLRRTRNLLIDACVAYHQARAAEIG